jgi:hypothetical protein
MSEIRNLYETVGLMGLAYHFIISEQGRLMISHLGSWKFTGK